MWVYTYSPFRGITVYTAGFTRTIPTITVGFRPNLFYKFETRSLTRTPASLGGPVINMTVRSTPKTVVREAYDTSSLTFCATIRMVVAADLKHHVLGTLLSCRPIIPCGCLVLVPTWSTSLMDPSPAKPVPPSLTQYRVAAQENAIVVVRS